ncbi:MAG TPA: YybS family protein [Bacillota bacterium]|nr:YybS family protein [Bacillota bacterium]
MNSKRITDGVRLTAVFIVILLVSLFVPIINIVAVFGLAVPFVIYSARHGWKAAVPMAIASVVLAFFVATFVSFPLALLMALGGLMIGQAIHANLSPYETWARGTVGFIIGLVFAFVFTQLVLHVNWMDEMEQMMREYTQMTKDLMAQFGTLDQADEQLALMEEELLRMTDFLPAGLAFAAILLAFISQWISYKVMNRLDDQTLRFPPFRTMKMPVSIVWIYFFALIVTFFDLDSDSLLLIASENVRMVAGMLMMIQGFSFIFFFSHHKKMSKALPIASVVVTLFLPFIFIFPVRILGIVDIGFGLRERLEKG